MKRKNITVCIATIKRKGKDLLVLKFSKYGERAKFKNLQPLLTVDFQIKFWKEGSFKSSYPYPDDNQAINDELSKYRKVISENPTFCLDDVYDYFKEKESSQCLYFFEYLTRVLNEYQDKKENFKSNTVECYDKLSRRLKEYNTNIDKVKFTDITKKFCKNFESWLQNPNGRNWKDYKNLTVCFLRILNLANNDESVKFDISNPLAELN